MKKNLLTLIACVATLFVYAQTGSFSVQVGAFDRKVNDDYFKSLSGVSYFKDRNDIHRYMIHGFSNKAEADKKADEAQKMGFNAIIINNDEVRKSCSLTCGVPTPPPAEVSSLNWIFFDFDKADLRTASKNQLDKLVAVLNQNPSYTCELSAHTDAKGSNEYNQALSERRANNAKTYVLNKGIAMGRIKTSTNGEAAPIAKNELAGGADTESGRQFNRRVEIRVFDASGKQLNVVEMPSIPDTLKQ